MATQRPTASDAPLVVIVGPTASGKTGVAVELAKKYQGEIICADSRTVYRGMDIGTAKPSIKERQGVPHWGLDLVDPGERFTAADFKMYANKKIREIRLRGHVPFLVGGAGLYVDALLFDYNFGGEADFKLRRELEGMSIKELLEYCTRNNVVIPENDKNKRYLVRAIERVTTPVERHRAPVSNSIIVGITTETAILNERIAQRTEQLFENGVVEEAIILGKKYGWDGEAFTGNIYKVVALYLSGEISVEAMKERFTVLDRRLAKRQRTWFKRNSYIHWLPLEEVSEYVVAQLAKR
jgi:tRNA dimethylallyltransferase